MKSKLITFLVVAMILFMYPAAHAKDMHIGDTMKVLDEDGYYCGRVMYTGGRDFAVFFNSGAQGYSVQFSKIPDKKLITINLFHDIMFVDFKMNNSHNSEISATCKDK